MPNIIGEDSKVIGYLGTLTELHNDGQTRTGCRILAKWILYMDCIDNGFIHKLNSGIGFEIRCQTSSNGQ